MHTAQWILEASIRKYQRSFRAQVNQHQKRYSDAELIASERVLKWATERLKYTENKKASVDSSLRDEFAAKALQGILSHPLRMQEISQQTDSVYEAHMQLANESYKIADAMLEARKPNPNNKDKI
jgi:hypothetical protein